MDGDGDLGKTEAGGGMSDVSRALAEPLPPFGAELPAAGKPRKRDIQFLEASVETAIVLELSVALLADPPTQLTVIGVDNEEGIVTLRGEVGTPEVRRMAGEIASSHPGVASAVNDLQISTSDVADPEREQEGGIK